MPSLHSATTPVGIDDPCMRSAGRELLSLAMMDARNHTLHLLAQFEQHPVGAAAARQAADSMDPPVWLGGHIAWLAEYWIGRNPMRGMGQACPADAPRLGSIELLADEWYSPGGMTRNERWEVLVPDMQSVRAYLLDTLESSIELLDKSAGDDDSLYFFRAALFHEDLRGEQLIAMAQALALPLKLELPGGRAMRHALLVPAGRWQLGMPDSGFVFDVEKWAHEIDVPEFEIDAQPVNWSQFVEFVDDGGYDRRECWSEGGWQWLEAEGRRAPRYVEQIGVASGAVMQMHFGRGTRMSGNQSAMHLNWWEADAWARWAGRRLPTEFEWEMAAHTAGRTGFAWGDVREWTASTLRPWPGFTPDAWTRHGDLEAQLQFGKARVLRGASFATRARMKHPKLRGFALPQRDDGFTGFRTCAP